LSKIPVLPGIRVTKQSQQNKIAKILVAFAVIQGKFCTLIRDSGQKFRVGAMVISLTCQPFCLYLNPRRYT
jgi:hypothetical protein